MTSLGQKFVHYPYALYATDVKFQPSHRPSGRFGEQKHYFSGKHKLYGLKIEASVSPDGRLVDMSPHVPGSVADLTLIRNRLDEHQRFLSKEASKSMINDKGYIGLAASLRAIHPKKKPTGGALDRHDLDRNKEVSSDRVIVENFFGRVSMLWKVSYATFVWGEKLYDDIQRLTFSLTNLHASLLPLRLEDHDSYRAAMARYKRMAAENTTKRAAAQRRYVQRRAERLAASAARADRVVFTSPSVNRRR
ncbi:hypothetical protein H257_08776 [Aphanomyces astaci]|uniref:DDE Tnp4 domain-containing protein n=1 Tax=Aphanomyces astaci TaxID=112090 RepID=W4GCD2_APHAT|nr:hypothetical protein H257_08776 [Aphanomyces astaci]ETV77330.1 hypothetical protein H257_08776 [Aphanomyces astaci]|eukprot:XP_009833117.1 hypothetical protein H257_08776 [Aphanomyces astaci]